WIFQSMVRLEAKNPPAGAGGYRRGALARFQL
ncbi:MAG: hypothetical protein ACI9OU_001356, partial [Candidatus Promineifilaceae bacterium]